MDWEEQRGGGGKYGRRGGRENWSRDIKEINLIIKKNQVYIHGQFSHQI